MRISRIAAITAMLGTASVVHAQQTPFDYGPVRPVQTSQARPSGPALDQGADGADLPVSAYRDVSWSDEGETRQANARSATTVSVGAGGVTTVTVRSGGPAASWGMVAGRGTHTAYVERPGSRSAPVAAPLLDAPEIDVAGAPQAFRVPRDPSSGHFVAAVLMNGVRTKVIIDTGATGTILSPEAARSTGALRDITHAQYAAGIGGVTALNATRIKSFVIGGREIGGFDALIGREGIPYTLLGQTELRRLGRIVIEDDVLTITPRDSHVALR